MKTVPIPKRFLDIAFTDPVAFTSRTEVKILIGLASETQGDLLEIGASLGATTRIMAKAFPKRTVFAVDWTGNKELNGMQKGEQPKIVAELAVGLPNVKTFNTDSRKFVYPPNVGFVFIDGDHTFEAVKADSEIAFAYGEDRPLLIAWHDVHSDCHVWVTKYLETVDKPERPIIALEGTMLAYCWTKPPPKSS